MKGDCSDGESRRLGIIFVCRRRIEPGDRAPIRKFGTASGGRLCGDRLIQSSVTSTSESSALCDGSAPFAMQAQVRSLAAPRQPSQKTKRELGYDVVRGLAAMGVIWVHSGRSPYWIEHHLSVAGSWGTAFLNTLAGFFVVFTVRNYSQGGSKGGGLLRFSRHRAWRLYGAFVVWSLVYV